MYHQPDIETMPREELRKLQLARMQETLKRCYENIPFYKDAFDKAGVKPEDLQSLEDLARFPFTVKQDMRDAYPDGLFAVPRSKVARIHASSGTTGQATIVGYTENDLKNWGECFARGISMVGGRPGDTLQVAYGYGLFTGGLGAHAGGEAAGLAVVPASTGNTARQLQMMRDLKVGIIACTPSYALHMADYAQDMGMDPAKDLFLKGGIFGAEPASESVREEIRRRFGIQYCDVYGLSEIMGPGVAMECAEGNGLHVAEDHFFVEILDPATLQPVPEGEMGELVITTLTKECCPLVRYRTRDLTYLISEPCACGRTHRKIGRILGRTDDMLIIRGVNVFPSQIEQVIASFPEVSPFYTITISSKGPLDVAELAVECAPDFAFDEVRNLESLKRRLKEALRSNLQIAVDIKLVEPKTIARSEGKAKHVIDLRQTTTAGRGATLTNVAPARH